METKRSAAPEGQTGHFPGAIAAGLREVVALAEPLLRAMSEASAARKPRPEKWSPKEILGHLIDSAGNNHQKFLRTQLAAEHLDFAGYEQDAWVSLQQYQQAQWTVLTDLWLTMNRHLAHVMEHTALERLGHTITVDGAGPFTLEFIMADYVEHLKHHLLQIFPEAPLESRFSNIYNT